MKPVLRRFVLALLTLVSLPGLGACSEDELWQRVEELERSIEERLPPGSSIEEVEAFLAEQGLDYHTGRSRGGDSSISRHDPALADRTVYVTGARIPDVYSGIIVKKGIYPGFYFDADRKLLWSTVDVHADAL